MGLQTWGETLNSLQVDGTAITNSAAQTSLLGAAGAVSGQSRYTIPANYLYIGQALRIWASGRISNIVTTPGTLTLAVKFGAISVFTSGAIALNVVAKTNSTWTAEMVMTCRSIGENTSATLMTAGSFTSESVVGAAAGAANAAMLPLNAPAVGTGFNSTVTNQVDLFATFSIANAGNSIQMHQYMLQALN